ncbi:MAG TPA: pyridoxal phosphate-dependent aminotransferase [Usitatibacter sp.]|jgi:aspartate/methionine/tyrosine aminotransferase|nr:pyridoxal phosphate-dependent aminotransferase [Usitatibacter sp.]
MNDVAERLHLAARMAHIEPFEVMEIQTLARQVEAAGHDVIHLEIGEPDFRTPAPVVEAAKRALDSQPMFYTSALGLAALREAISRFYAQRYRVDVPAARIVVTAGSSAALLLAFGVLLDPGDEVLLADPGYPCNRHFVRALGAVPRAVPVGPDSRYQLTPELARRHWAARTRMAMVATPANPTGTLATSGEIAQLAQLVREKGGHLLVDEIYHGLTYGLDAPTGAAAGDDVLVVNSFSKYFQMTGWRLGWMVVPARLVRAVETLAQNLFISPSTLAQHAALACFEPATIAILEERRAELDARRRYLVPALQSLGFGVPVVPEGAFYIYADVSAVTPDSFAFARKLLGDAHVAITPGKDFGRNHPERHVRIAYTQPVARLEEAVNRIARFLGRG